MKNEALCSAKWYSSELKTGRVIRETTLSNFIISSQIISNKFLEDAALQLAKLAVPVYQNRIKLHNDIYVHFYLPKESKKYPDTSITIEYTFNGIEMLQISSIGLESLIDLARELHLPIKHLKPFLNY